MRRRLSARGLCELFLRSGLYDRRRDRRSESEFESELELEESEESESLSDDEDSNSIFARSSIINFWAFCTICEHIWGINKNTGCYLQVLPHLNSQHSQVDTCKEVDGEACILGDIRREHGFAVLPNIGVLEPIGQFRHPHRFTHFLHRDLDENAAGRCGIVLIYLDDLEHGP